MAAVAYDFDYDLIETDDQRPVRAESLESQRLPYIVVSRSVGGGSGYFFATMSNTDVRIQDLTELRASMLYHTQRGTKVKNLLDFDLHDLAVMVGTGCFAGAVGSVIWSMASPSPIPSYLSLTLAAAGFVGGRFMAEKSKVHHDDR